MTRLLSILLVLSLLAPACASAQDPVSLLWDFSSGGHHIRCLGVIEDMEGRLPGSPDVLVEIDNTGDPDGHFKLLAGHDGSELWGVSPPGGASDGCGYGDMCVSVSPDLNGDGLEEALLGTAWGGRTAYAILADDSGAVLWDFDTYVDDPPSGWVYSLDWIPDVTGDGVPEIVFGCGSDNDNAYCVNGATGAMIWKFAAPDAVYSVARLGDVNFNGASDVLVATGDAYADYTYCIDGGSTGYATYLWRFYVGDTSYTVAGVPDVDNDRIPDALIGTWDSAGTVYCVSGFDGSEIWSHSIGSYVPVMRVVPIDDLNDDGRMEVLVASWDNAIICLDGLTGNEHWNVPTGTTNGGDVWAIWPLGDVDYDGYADVLAGSFDLKAYCVSGRTGELIWDYTVGNRVYTVRGIGDVNDDGVDEALVGTQYTGGTGGKVFCLDADGDATSVPSIDDLACTAVEEGVLVSWTVGPAAVGFNVYRMVSAAPPGALELRLSGSDGDLVRELLDARAGAGARDGFTKLNGELVVGREFLDRSVIRGVRYVYLVGAVSADGQEVLAGPVEVVAELSGGNLWLAPPAPNPITEAATFEFTAPPGERAALSIYSPAGRLIKTVYSGRPEGRPVVISWDGSSRDGGRVPSGVYLVRLEAGGRTAGRNIVLVR